ncbi:SGNH/GDSL hydrolase family protein [Flammeovirgaceae bacterium SG7u.111]|nr:SGNH/GDSL hydrolase family protein [Flammeovirgaceae bacterium SG7u.132]WPO37048.1 SGNH/GDSL hydrolase family protein [Flammeovirgaceae bacterium SG7u.111]
MTTTPSTDSTSSTIKYLALGDSYTIGESVATNERWPVQLSKKLEEEGLKVEPPKIIATTGWTTDELQKAINAEKITNDYDLVSLLIGVNNQYRGYPFEQYEKEFEELLIQSISFTQNRPERVFVVSIPDYGVTPFASARDSQKIALELDNYNEKASEICEKYQVAFYNITPYSRTAKNDEALLASDGLHPSGKMYTGWVNIFWKDVKNLLEK